jgi:hypothetical protein
MSPRDKYKDDTKNEKNYRIIPARNASEKAANARPRWLMASFSPPDISAKVRADPAGRKTGS